MQLKCPAQDVQKARRCQIFTYNKVPYKGGHPHKTRNKIYWCTPIQRRGRVHQS